MPRVKRTDFQEREAIQRSIIAGRVEYLGKNLQRFFVEDLGLSQATGYRKYKHPGLFTADEIRRMKLSPEESARFISGK